MTRRALLICYYFPPLGLGGVGRPLHLFRGLPGHGWECDVLTVKSVAYRACEPELLEGLDQSKIFRAGSRDPQRLLYLLGVRKVGATAIARGQSVSGKFFPDSKVGWAKPAIGLGGRLCRKNRYDAIVSTSPPISCHLIGRELHHQFGIPWVADFRDYWSIYPVEKTFADPARVQQGLKLLGEITSEADSITAVNTDIVKYLKSGNSIPNGYDTRLADGWRSPPDDKKFTIGLLGHNPSAETLQPLADLLKQMVAITPDTLESVRIIQVGQIDSDWLRNFFESNGLNLSIDIHGRQSRSETISILSTAHMFYLGLTPKEGSGFLPGKTFDMLASGRPIVAFTPDDSQVGRLIAGSGRGRGVCFQADTTAKAAQYVLGLIQSVKEGSYQFEPLSDYARQYSSDQLVARFAKVLDGLV